MSTRSKRSAAILLGFAAAGILGTVSACEYYAKHFQIIHPSAELPAAGATTVAVSMELVQVERHDRLLRAESPIARSVELVAAEAADAATAFSVEPGRDTVLEAGGSHLLLRGLTRELHATRQYPLTLHFEHSGEVHVDFVVGDH